jgi:hypothetical protein
MLIAEATVETERPSRYLVQFCKHAAAMGGGQGHGPRVHLRAMLGRREVRVAAEWSETRGVVTFDPWGRCTVTAAVGTLTLRVDATDEDGLGRIQDVITRDFNRFGRRERLTVAWRRPETPGVTSDTGPAA